MARQMCLICSTRIGSAGLNRVGAMRHLALTFLIADGVRNCVVIDGMNDVDTVDRRSAAGSRLLSAQSMLDCVNKTVV